MVVVEGENGALGGCLAFMFVVEFRCGRLNDTPPQSRHKKLNKSSKEVEQPHLF